MAASLVIASIASIIFYGKKNISRQQFYSIQYKFTLRKKVKDINTTFQIINICMYVCVCVVCTSQKKILIIPGLMER